MVEHDLEIHLQLTPLVDQTNEINSRLRSMDTDGVYRATYQSIEYWRIQSHTMIDAYCADKLAKLNAHVAINKQKYEAELRHIQGRIIAHMRDRDTTHDQIDSLNVDVRNLQNQLMRLEQADMKFHIRPLDLDGNWISFDQSLDMSTLPSVYKSISRDKDSFTSLATNDRLLLLHRQGRLLLVDDDFSVVKQIPWTNGLIYDMCYSSTLDRFIVINANEVFLLNERDMRIGKIESIPWQEWFCCTCSESSLYLTTKVYGSAIMHFTLAPMIAFQTRWESPDTCTSDEAIDGIEYNNHTLAMMISNDSKRVLRLELRSAETLERLWTLPLYIVYDPKHAFRFCAINQNEWLVADHSDSRLLHVSQSGMVKSSCSYRPAPCCLIEFGQNMLVVSTKAGVYSHRL